MKRGQIMLQEMARAVSFAATLLAFSAWLAAFTAAPAQAQPDSDYPNRLIRVISPVAPGGISDTVARAVAQHLADTFHQQAVVENKAGGNFQIGINYLTAQPADGYNLVVLQEGAIVLNPHLYAGRLSYDPDKDLAPISAITKVDQVLLVHPSVPANNVAEFLALAKEKPDSVTVASFGPGTPPSLFTEMLHLMVPGTKFNTVMYRGAAPMLTDVAAGHVNATFISVGQALPLYREGKIKILATLSLQRLPVLPDIPSMAETVPGFEGTAWHGLFAKAGTPQPIIDKLNAEMRRMGADPGFQERVLKPNYFRSIAGSTADMAEMIKVESAKWKKFVAEAKISVE
jgi:tripartite-type tricarboxylate transporter receptor subunit TctC